MLRDVPFNIVYSTGDNEPIEFFFNALTESNQFDLGLGYFSSTAINVLSAGFAYFIHKGGKMRIIINDLLSQDDKDAIIEGTEKKDINFEDRILDDIWSLAKVLSNQDEHFFKCLSYLISKDRLEFIAVVPKNRKGGIAHNKYGIFTDEDGNKVVFNGSANFSRNALLNNVESISCYKSWSDSHSDLERLYYFEEIFHRTWIGESENVKIIPIEKVKSHILTNYPVKDSIELLEEGRAFLNEMDESADPIKSKMDDLYEEVLSTTKEPSFPFPDGAREYQIKAYERWVKNNYQGLFAMATGTGKTITSLNCVLEEYHKSGEYKILILVPTRALVQQWIIEVKKFNFSNIHSTHENGWFDLLSNYFLSLRLGIENNIVFISTYQSFNGDKFQKLTEKSGWEKFILIADEAHNMGSSRSLDNFPYKIAKRIGLSATPERIYDDTGSNEIYVFFNSFPPCYTYSYSMYRAIHTEPASLVKYFYFPFYSSLNEIELKEYKAITEKLIQNYNSKSGEFSEYGKRLLIMRKRIINQARNKINTLNEIFIDVRSKENSLKYTFVYVPEGTETDYTTELLPSFRPQVNKYKFSYYDDVIQCYITGNNSQSYSDY